MSGIRINNDRCIGAESEMLLMTASLLTRGSAGTAINLYYDGSGSESDDE